MVAKGDNDGGLDMSPLPGPGVSQQTLDDVRAGLELLKQQAAIVQDEIGKAVKMADDQAAWANVVSQLGELVLGTIDQMVLAHRARAEAPETPGLRSQLFNGLVDVWQRPKDERGAAFTSLLQGLMRQAAN